MAIFNSYVSLPEGKYHKFSRSCGSWTNISPNEHLHTSRSYHQHWLGGLPNKECRTNPSHHPINLEFSGIRYKIIEVEVVWGGGPDGWVPLGSLVQNVLLQGAVDIHQITLLQEVRRPNLLANLGKNKKWAIGRCYHVIGKLPQLAPSQPLGRMSHTMHDEAFAKMNGWLWGFLGSRYQHHDDLGFALGTSREWELWI